TIWFGRAVRSVVAQLRHWLLATPRPDRRYQRLGTAPELHQLCYSNRMVHPFIIFAEGLLRVAPQLGSELTGQPALPEVPDGLPQLRCRDERLSNRLHQVPDLKKTPFCPLQCHVAVVPNEWK